jgi:hypothetical protein
MLDDFATEMDATQGKMNGVVKRVAKVLHMSNGTTGNSVKSRKIM